jgi:hypothetical protein
MKEIKKSSSIKSKVKGKETPFNVDLNYSEEYDSFNIKVKKDVGFMSYTDSLQGLPLEVVQKLNEMLEEVLIKAGSKTEMKEHKMFDGGNFQSGVYANGGGVGKEGVLQKYFKNYPKCKELSYQIEESLGDNLTDNVANKIIKLADTFSFETPIKYAKGGSLIGNQKRIDMNHNGKIDAEDFKIMRTTMNGAWRNEHKHVNSTSRKDGKVIDYEVIYARKFNPSRKGYKGKTNFANGGGVGRFSEYSNDALYDMIINLSRYENTESEIQMVKAELEKRKANKKMTTGGGIGIEEEIDLTDDKRLRLRKPVMPERKYSEKDWAEKFNPRAYEFMGKRKMASGGSLPSGSINALGDLWFAVQQKDTDDYKMVSQNLDKLKVPFAIQNEVSADAETQRGRKALNIPEVHDRIKKIVEKNGRKFAKGGKTEQGVDLFEDYENIPPKLQAILEKYEYAFENGDYRGLQKALEEANKIGYTFEYYLDGQAYDLRKIGEKGKSEVEEYALGGRVNKDIKITPTIENFIDKLKKQGIYNKGNQQKNVNGVLYRFDEYKLNNPSSFMLSEFKKIVEKSYGVLSLSNGYDSSRINLEGNKVIVADLPKFKGGNTNYITFRELVILNKNGGAFGKISFEDWLKKNNIEVYKRTYYWVADDGGSDYLYSGSKGDVMKSLREDYKKSFANGGAFEKLSNKVARNYEGKRVKPQYQKEYGKVYSKSEAKEVGNKVAGKVKANQKMATGGETKKGGQGGIMVLAKKIRKEGESWKDALKRAGQQLK